jgi:hypothetical protein
MQTACHRISKLEITGESGNIDQFRFHGGGIHFPILVLFYTANRLRREIGKKIPNKEVLLETDAVVEVVYEKLCEMKGNPSW